MTRSAAAIGAQPSLTIRRGRLGRVTIELDRLIEPAERTDHSPESRAEQSGANGCANHRSRARL